MKKQPARRKLSKLTKIRRATARLVEAEAELLAATGEALRRSQALNTAILEAALDSIITINHAGCIVEINPATTKIFGYRRADMIGRPFTELLSPPMPYPARLAGLERFVIGREGALVGKRVELAALRADGSEFPIELSVTRVGAPNPPMFAGYIRDLSERRHAEATRAQLAAIVESSNDAVISNTLDGTITSWNKAAGRLYGYSAEEVIGRSISILGPAERLDEVSRILEGLRRGESLEHFDTVRLRKDGRRIDISLTISPIRDSAGEIIGASAIARNITRRKRLQESLDQLHRLHRQILNSVSEGIHGIDIEGAIIFINPAAANMLGYNTEELIGQNSHLTLHHSRADGAPHPADACPIYAALRDGLTHRRDNDLFWRKDGTHCSVELISTPIRDEDGRVTGAVIAFHDITERKRAERNILLHLKRIRALHEIERAINSTLDVQIVLDVLLEKLELFIPIAALSSIRLFDQKTGTLERLACRGISEDEWKPRQRRISSERGKRIMATRKPLTVRNVQQNPQNGHFFRKHGFASYLGVPLIAQDEVLGVLGVYTQEEHNFTDEEIEFLDTIAGYAAIAIHKSKLYEEVQAHVNELQAKTAELEGANKVKDEFLAVISHELRTPVNVVLGYTELFRQGILGETNPGQENALRKISSQTKNLLTIVNNILFATTIEANELTFDIEEFSVGNMLGELRAHYAAPDSQSVSLQWDYPDNFPPFRSDPRKLKQILDNLIDNAIKFTAEGHVSITARLPETTGNLRPPRGDIRRWLEIEITDTGIGIQKDALPKIFGKFYQADSSQTRGYGGTGLGLYIAKKFTDLIDATLTVESKAGKGTTFTLTVPGREC